MTPEPRRDGPVWSQSIPADWRFLKFSWVVNIAEGQIDPENATHSDQILVAPNHIESGTGRLLARETASEQGAISGKYPCRRGDVLYSKIRPALRKATIAKEDCLCSADMYPLRPREMLGSRYLLYLIVSKPFTEWAVLESDRVAMPKINRESLNDLRIPVPPLQVQDNYDDKDSLRAALVRDQRGLCCYCMTRVEATGTRMKIEHWRCQSRHADLELAYSNLLGACLGGHGQPEALQHCDTRKGEQDLKFNPADLDHRIEQRIRFEMDGTIASGDADFNSQLSKVLNLNLTLLKNRRKSVLTAILEWWKGEKERLKGPVPDALLVRERARRVGDGAGSFTPFEPVALWWLDQRLGRRAS